MKQKIERLEKTDEVSKYYDDLIKTISDEWINKNYSLAIELLNEELSQPYIPYEYEQLMEDMLFSYNRELKLNEIDSKIKNMSIDDMIVNIFVNNKFNVYLFELFIEKFGDDINESHLNIIQLWLLSKYISNTDKFRILDSLYNLGINHQFKFYNANINQETIINSVDYKSNSYINEYKKVYDILYEMHNKEQVLFNFENDVLEYCAHYYFPTFPFSGYKNLANAIYYVVNSFMDNLKLNFNKLNDDEKIVYKIIEMFEDKQNNL